MAVITNATTTTSVTEVINSEYISRVILDVHREPTIASLIGWVVDASGSNAGVYTFPKADDVTLSLTEASPKSETDEIAASEQTYTEVQATAAMLGIRRALSDEAMQDSLVDQVAFAVRQNMEKLRDQGDIDLMLNVTGATNQADFSGAALDITKMGTAIAQYRALKPTGGPGAIVLSYAQIEDLAASVRSSSAAIFGSAFGDRQAGSMLDGSRVGALGSYEGFMLYQTGNVPAFDGSNDSGFICSTGVGGALGMALWQGIQHEPNREPTRKATDIVSTARWGTALVDQENLVEIVSLNS